MPNVKLLSRISLHLRLTDEERKHGQVLHLTHQQLKDDINENVKDDRLATIYNRKCPATLLADGVNVDLELLCGWSIPFRPMGAVLTVSGPDSPNPLHHPSPESRTRAGKLEKMTRFRLANPLDQHIGLRHSTKNLTADCDRCGHRYMRTFRVVPEGSNKLDPDVAYSWRSIPASSPTCGVCLDMIHYGITPFREDFNGFSSLVNRDRRPDPFLCV
jgi:hypothetical protein